MSVNVGLDTASAGVRLRPSTMPFAIVVLPAPRLPINSTTPPVSSAPHRRPGAMVSSSECVWNIRDSTNALGEIAEKVGCNYSLFGLVARRNFPCERGQIYGGRNRPVGARG